MPSSCMDRFFQVFLPRFHRFVPTFHSIRATENHSWPRFEFVSFRAFFFSNFTAKSRSYCHTHIAHNLLIVTSHSTFEVRRLFTIASDDKGL